MLCRYYRNGCLVCEWPNNNPPARQTTQRGKAWQITDKKRVLNVVVSIVMTEHAQQEKESYHDRGFSHSVRKQQQ